MKSHRRVSVDDERKEPLKGKNAAKWLLLIGAALCLLAYAGYMFVSQAADYRNSEKLYEDTITEYVSSNEAFAAEENITSWEDLADVDLARLSEINDEIAGWIFFENEDISYPVLYSGDDSKYLRTAYTGDTFSAGSIFMEGKNSRDFSDVHTILYGHNMKDLTMFGKLKYYVKDQHYIDDHEYFQIITQNAKYRYKIFAYKIVPEDADIYTVHRTGSPEFLSFIKNAILSGNYRNADEQIRYTDHLITLSTCVREERLVVTAVRCDEYPIDRMSYYWGNRTK